MPESPAHGGAGDMPCRDNCGACCIAPSIHQPFAGMHFGKPAGVACVHLGADMRCAIFNSPLRPRACARFRAEPSVCGTSRAQALALITRLERDSAPAQTVSGHGP